MRYLLPTAGDTLLKNTSVGNTKTLGETRLLLTLKKNKNNFFAGRDHMRDLDVDGRIILKIILYK
jgi:hypothetical protein